MNYCVGIDLGSTTTKAVILGENGAISAGESPTAAATMGSRATWRWARD